MEPRRSQSAWLFLLGALAWIQSCRAHADIHARVPQTSGPNNCGDGPYTAPNGLKFNVQCNSNSPGNDIINVTATDVYDCMNQCSAQEFLCYGAIWDNNIYNRCFFKSSNISTAPVGQEQDVFIGIANTTQLEPLPTRCPYTNQSVQTTSQNYKFRIHCRQDYGGFDVTNPSHADTLADCMEQCDTVQPLCLGVAWNPDLQHGYDNCYFKNNNDPANLNAAVYVVHTALALNNQIENFNSSCNDGSTYTSNNKEFTLHCGQDRPGADLYANHTSDLGACIDLCANYFNSSTGACQAVAFNPDSSKSWANCYLKTSATSAVSNGDFDFAILTNSQAGNGSSNGNGTTVGSGDSSGGSSSKAWIAGPVIGGIAAIAIIAGAFWWLRRRRNRNNSDDGQYALTGQRDSQDKPENNVESLPHGAGYAQGSAYNQVDHKIRPEAAPPIAEADAGQSRHEMATGKEGSLPQELGTGAEVLPPQELDATSPSIKPAR